MKALVSRLLLTVCAVGLSTTAAVADQVTVLLGETVVCDASASQGHPVAYEWYVTEPNGTPPAEPTSTSMSFPLTLTTTGLWTVDLTARYLHEAPDGTIHESSTSTTINVKSVVAAIALSSSHIFTDEPLTLDGSASTWAVGVTPTATWMIDGGPFGACNGGPPPGDPAELLCVIPAHTLEPGAHTASLLLEDTSSGDQDEASAPFTVEEIIPLSVDFNWEPFNPDPHIMVQFNVEIQPPDAEADMVTATWEWGDGSPPDIVDCQTPWGCMIWGHEFDQVGWYQVSLTVVTSGETDAAQHDIEIGDAPQPPTADFTVTPTDPPLLHQATFTFTGQCEEPCTYLWEFGDGATASTGGAVHAYPVPGPFTARLTVTNGGGVDSTNQPVMVTPCWDPPDPQQTGSCYGGPVLLTGPTGAGFLWSTGATSQSVTVGQPGPYWVDVDSGGECWGHAPWTVNLTNCGDPGGDANLDGTTNAADLTALIRELTDGDGNAVATAGGGDLSAPGGDVTGDGLLDSTDLQAIISILFASP